MQPLEARDLRWVLTSPSLIDPSSSDVVAAPASTDFLPFDTADLLAFLHERPTRRVGYYFENLILYWLERMRGVDMVARRRQIRNGQQTVGELDFVYHDEQGRLTHLETAVKFYLFCPEAGSGEDTIPHSDGRLYIGPNSADTFARKINRLFEKQLPLGRRTFPDVEVSRALVKGRIFYHPDVAPPQSLPPRLSPSHLTGHWLYQSELGRLASPAWFNRAPLHRQSLDRQPGELFYRRLRKPFWLAPQREPLDTPGLLPQTEVTETLQEHFRSSRQPVLLSALQKRSHFFEESARVFIVPGGWPQQSA